MALIVESGAGLPNSEAFISVSDADTYFSNRGNAAWAALNTAAKEAALRLSTDYMGAVYGPRWGGERLTDTQALDWPRGEPGVPEAVKRANAELAVRASAGALLGDQGAQVKSETVGPISVTYAEGARQGTRYAAVDAGLKSAGLLCGGAGGGTIPVVKA